jgi:hypothetical protein
MTQPAGYSLACYALDKETTLWKHRYIVMNCTPYDVGSKAMQIVKTLADDEHPLFSVKGYQYA